MEQQLFLGGFLESRKGSVLFQLILCTFIVPVGLQFASVKSAASVKEVKMLFGAMANLWKLFYYSPKKAETLANVQAVLNLPEMKIVKPSDTRWLSHE